MDWTEVERDLPQDAAAPLRQRILTHLRDRLGFVPEVVLKKVIVLADGNGRRMLWGVGSVGVQNFYLGADLAALLPPDILRTLPIKLHSARTTYLGAYEGPTIEVKRSEDLVLLDALAGDPFPRALQRWIGCMTATFPNWQSFATPDEDFEREERTYKLLAARSLKQDLDAAKTDAERLEALHKALIATNMLQWRVYWPISPKGDADHAAMAQAVTALVVAAQHPPMHPRAVADFIAAWMLHCPNPQRDAARQVAEYALMLLCCDAALLLRRSLLDALYLEANGIRFPRGEAEAEYNAEIAFAHRIKAALQDAGYAPRDMIDVQSLLWVAFNADEGDTNPITKLALPPKETAMQTPLNTILYGPPGTGKTHATRLHAVTICDGPGAADMDPAALHARYEALREAGRIAFVTFHQSFSYEDFVEGLRPVTEEGGAGFRLSPTPGILRNMADLAAKGRAVSTAVAAVDISKRGVFKMSLGRYNNSQEAYLFEECIQHGHLLLGWGGNIDWTDKRFDTWVEILMEWQKTDPSATGNNANVTSIWSFRNDMKVGDLVIVPNGSQKFRAIGEVTGPYQFVDQASENEYSHRRAVRWLWWDEEGLPLETLIEGRLANMTVHRIPPAKVKRDALAAYLAPPSDERLPHVLVIDEINRANVSKVFGELITLLEEDKRAGEANAVTLKLPYSGENFSLPANLHILGTMNTADRSIALLDTALRRRFQFVEMAPDAGVLGVVEGVDLGLLLMRLNERIEYLFDRDHLIGHAFFMGCRTRGDVDGVMRRKVIPLLAEYFHEDWERIIAVLGGPVQGFVDRQILPLPPGIEAVTDEPRYRYLVRGVFGADAYAGLQG